MNQPPYKSLKVSVGGKEIDGFACQYCEKIVTDRDAIIMHLAVVHGIRLIDDEEVLHHHANEI